MIPGVALIGVGLLMLWSGFTGNNGFGELGKMLRGEAAFVRRETAAETAARGGGGELTGIEGTEGGSVGSGTGGGGGGAW